MIVWLFGFTALVFGGVSKIAGDSGCFFQTAADRYGIINSKEN